MLGGNPEWLAKAELRKKGYEEALIAEATGTAVSVSEEALEVRKEFRLLYDQFKEEIAPEAKQVCDAGGLFIIGTERHESRRIDNQLRGRAGRQGDPGESRFYLSLEDDLMRLFGSERIIGMVERLGLDEDQPIDARILSNSIETAQKRLEAQNFNRRKTVLTYDDVMNKQRELIYGERNGVLDGLDLRDKIHGMMNEIIDTAVKAHTMGEIPDEWDFAGLRRQFMGILTKEDDFQYDAAQLNTLVRENIADLLKERAEQRYAEKEALFGDNMRELERVILLRCVDMHWMQHLEDMDSLRESIGLNAYAQRNPINEYRIAGAELFDEMIAGIREDTVMSLLTVMPRPQEEIKRVEVAKPIAEGFVGDGSQTQKKKPVVRKTPKVGRNDPCPCGSGKKYKKCCGMNESDDTNHAS